MRIRSVTPAVAAVALLAALTACGPGGTAGPSSSPSGSSTPSASASSTPDPAVTTTAAPVTQPPCTRNELNTATVTFDGTAGQLHGELVVVNVAEAPCSLTGYPTLYVGEPEAEGTMGAPATHDANDPGVPLDLAPGDSAVARITVTQAGNIDGCNIVDTDYFVFAVPGTMLDLESNGRHIYADAFQGCRNDGLAILSVSGFHAG